MENEVTQMLITGLIGILGGGTGAAVVAAMNERWKFKAQRKAQKEDRAEEKADKTEEIGEAVEEIRKTEDKRQEEMEQEVSVMKKQIEALVEADRVILLDRIRHLGQSYIQKGEISFDDRRIFHMMHDAYHNGLNGNGDADLIVEAVDELPLTL